MKVYRTAIVMVAASVWLTACQRVVAPAVELNGVRLAGIGLRGATLIADLSIENPNDFAIETDSITFDFEASDPDQAGTWTSVTTGTNREPLRIEAAGRATVEIPIEFAYADLSAPVRSILDKGTFKYRIRGNVVVGEPRRTTAPFSENGSLSLGGG